MDALWRVRVPKCDRALWVKLRDEARAGHNQTTCSYNGERVTFSGAIPRSPLCECCGKHAKTHRHHTRGRADDSDFLDICTDCHLTCCHDGDFYTIGIKPRVCRIKNRKSFWVM